MTKKPKSEPESVKDLDIEPEDAEDVTGGISDGTSNTITDGSSNLKAGASEV